MSTHVVTILEPIPYPAMLHNSFYHLRQQLDLLAQFRVNSVVYISDEEDYARSQYTKHGLFIPFSYKPRKPRILRYLFDGFLPAKEFVEKVHKAFPRIKVICSEWKG